MKYVIREGRSKKRKEIENDTLDIYGMSPIRIKKFEDRIEVITPCSVAVSNFRDIVTIERSKEE